MRIEIEIPDAGLHTLLDSVPIPWMAPIAQTLETPVEVGDVALAIAAEMRESGVLRTIQPGRRIAVAVGSRGIDRLPEIVAAVVRELREAGAQPFVIPAMGSHGGATASGQTEVLEHLGVTRVSVDAPIYSSMDVVEIGTTDAGLPVYVDRIASEADGVVLVARVKPHTMFRGAYESGLAKMIAIGLGNQAGASVCHSWGYDQLATSIPAAAEITLSRTSILFGVAVMENAYDRIYEVHVVPADRMLTDEPRLLESAAAAMPRIPFDQIDVLVIDRIGKNISGEGADPNITGRYSTNAAHGGPRVTREVIFDLTEETDGNAIGVGSADFTTVRLVRKVDLGSTYPNGITATLPGPLALPCILPSDRLALAAALATCMAGGREPRVVRIPNTLHLERLAVSASMLAEVESNGSLRLLDPPGPLPFDPDGNLIDLGADVLQRTR